VNIPWNGRLFVTLNDDPESVGLLPEVNANTKDKMMFFASRPYQGQWEDRSIIEARIAAELPFFARWLLNWKAPESVLAGGRMGVASFYDPRILLISLQQGTAYGLLELIQQWTRQGPYWNDKEREWGGTASELLSQFEVTDGFRAHMKEWTQNRIAKALTTLTRQGQAGITSIEGGRFRIVRAEVEKQPQEEVAV
jgi:hypothetical protein